MAENQTYWLSPFDGKCQVTGEDCNGVMYDAKLPAQFGGVWANISHSTFVALGCKTGIGLGQKYERQPDGRWLCVEGNK